MTGDVAKERSVVPAWLRPFFFDVESRGAPATKNTHARETVEQGESEGERVGTKQEQDVIRTGTMVCAFRWSQMYQVFPRGRESRAEQA